MNAPILPYRVDLPPAAAGDKSRPYRSFKTRLSFDVYISGWEDSGYIVQRVSSTLAIVEPSA